MIVYSLSIQRLNVAFTDAITIKIDGKEFALTKFGTQGNNGATYKVTGQAAFAKTNFKAGTIAKEAEVTGLV